VDEAALASGTMLAVKLIREQLEPSSGHYCPQISERTREVEDDFRRAHEIASAQGARSSE
jgi:hypothetical protein